MLPGRPNHSRGFTLLELIIVIGIIALLGTIGFVAFGAIRSSQEKRNTVAAMEIARSMFNAFVNSARSGGNNLTMDSTGASTTFYLRLAPPVWAFNTDAYAPTAVPQRINFREKVVEVTPSNKVPFSADYEKTIDYYNVPRRDSDVKTGIMVPMNVPLLAAAQASALDPKGNVSDELDADRWQLHATMLMIRRMRSSPEAKSIWSTLRDSQIKHVGDANSGKDFIIDAWGNPILFVPGSGLRGLRWGTGEFTGTAGKSWVNGDPTSGGVPLDQQATRSPDGKPFWVSAGPDGFYDTQDDNIYSFNN